MCARRGKELRPTVWRMLSFLCEGGGSCRISQKVRGGPDSPDPVSMVMSQAQLGTAWHLDLT